jgi:uncharacterized protein YabN with tetrapyrrole methylase and pyrophosphatase domain
MASRAADEFARLVEIMATLRAPGGCPWDREQTIDSLKPFVLEETYEVLEAIDRHDHGELCEELGDFIFEAVFLAQLEAESSLAPSGAVRTQWEEIKKQERGGQAKPNTLLSGIATTLPALLRAYHIGSRAASVGFDWSRPADVVDKIQEEVDELREVAGRGQPIDQERAEEEMGDLLFAIANLARKLGIEPETALRKANDKFTGRFEAMERALADAGRTMREMSLAELEEQWRQVKSRGRLPD